MKTAWHDLSSPGARAPDDAPIARLIGVSKQYRDVAALSHIDLTVRKGEMLAIVGPSGSGKTTLLNLIGLLDRPSQGELELLGESTTPLTPAEYAARRRRAIGFVFQSYNLIPVLDALDNVLLPLRLNGQPTPAERERAEALLGEVGLAQQIRKRPDQMSGGQRQRVAIARALIAEPQLVIADEPTASLDSQNTRAAMQLFQRLNRGHGVTFVFSTHDERALGYMDRCLTLCDGQLLDRGEL
ncbi:ABC transporter ATP-binding protein (plasmid) [Burkholderia sp. FERM BP-3421]|jgi:putative ABC transport system ATP-binding protein|uniref:ABC transporter ATP-binding protein n=1 Tax=Burkholderia sp. FERM BP-3421 TaxID=1494466 RepID=UPI00235F3E71|nr:ABC transporter ATP-binding protein [Burkholderia sp. FERM BP-3421]WDD90537.1 ABC transporter ATP-binding protein [Burkholderia sp. FERM BP-3421]